MPLLINEELENSAIKDFLPQNLSHKMLAYIGLKVNKFIDHTSYAEADNDKDQKFKFDNDILDIVTKLYINQHGDHEIDTSDINNIILFQQKLWEGATYYSLAVYRESVGRDSGIEYEKPTLKNILTKKPQSYKCEKLYEFLKQKTNMCKNCSTKTL